MKILALSVALLFLMSGCNQSEAERESRLSLLKASNPSPVQISNDQDDIAEQVKADVMAHKEIFDAAVIKGEKNTLVVYKVKHLQRFRMKQIETQVTKELENKYSNEKFTVSSDYKIFMEALKLKEKFQDPKFSQSKAEKELEKIIKLKNEQT